MSNNNTTDGEQVRIDKWLWSVRLFKTRSQAAEACQSGRVKMGGVCLKPSHAVRVGERYDISIEQLHKQVEVKQLLHTRVGAKLVDNYLVDLTPEEEYERIRIAREFGFERRDRGIGRPTKRDRREIEDFKYK
ncbi:MAG: RNA-binding S4 domain-containing protein [Bacteroidales bacterium]|nr:RNA-binding S4 domain-containing protein [Bacteroidales bacterium]